MPTLGPSCLLSHNSIYNRYSESQSAWTPNRGPCIWAENVQTYAHCTPLLLTKRMRVRFWGTLFSLVFKETPRENHPFSLCPPLPRPPTPQRKVTRQAGRFTNNHLIHIGVFPPRSDNRRLVNGCVLNWGTSRR